MRRRNEQMRDLPYFTHEEYELMKMPLAREEVPDGALAALSAWIEGERLLVDRDGEKGWKLVQIRNDSSYGQFVPVLAARSKAVEEIKKRLGNDLGDDQ